LLGPNVTNNKLFEKDILNAMANANISFVSRRDEIIVREIVFENWQSETSIPICETENS